MRVLPKPTKLLIHFEGFEKLWAVKQSITIPRSAIVSVRYYRSYRPPADIVRLGGGNVPARVTAGLFTADQKRLFLCLKETHGKMRRTEDVLVIRTRDYVFDEVAISLKPAIAREVIGWWRNTSRPT